MTGETVIWHVVVANEERGPLTDSEVREYLREGKLSGSDLIWRPGFHDWKAVRDTNEFWQPPPRATTDTSISAAPTPVEIRSTPVTTGRPYEIREPHETKAAPNWSLWSAANWGLVVSAITLLLQVGNGRGYEIARLAYGVTAEGFAAPAGRVLGVPFIFIVIAIVRNALKSRPPSTANAARGAALFFVLLVSIFCAIESYSLSVFSSPLPISGMAREKVVALLHRSCVQKQQPGSQYLGDGHIDNLCSCVAEYVANGMTYQQMAAIDDPSVFAAMKQKFEFGAKACR